MNFLVRWCSLRDDVTFNNIVEGINVRILDIIAPIHSEEQEGGPIAA